MSRYLSRLNFRVSILGFVATLVVAIVFVPLVYLAIRTVGAGSDFWDILTSSSVLFTLVRTLGLAIAVAVTSSVVGIVLAWLTSRTNIPGRHLLAVTLALPLAFPSFIMALTFRELYGPRGAFQGLLELLFGVERLASINGFVGSFIVLVLLTYPLVFLAVRGAITRLDPGLEYAARSLGRSNFKMLLNVVIPALKPAIVGSTVLVALYVIGDFGVVATLQFDTLTVVVFQQLSASINLQLAAGFSLVLSILAIVLVLLSSNIRILPNYKSGPSAERTPEIYDLGRWRWLVLIIISLFVIFALGGNLAALFWWFIRGLIAGNSVVSLWGPIFNSLTVALVAAVATSVMALPIALFISGRPGLYSSGLRLVTLVVYSLPGVVVAIALVFLGINVINPLYQTYWLLVFAYVIMFIAIPLNFLRAPLNQINPHLSEAAASMGYGPVRRFTAIVLPWIMPGLLLGSVMVFLFVLKELPATLLLSPANFQTLATEIWNSSSEGFFTRAGLACLILVAAGFPATYLLMRFAYRAN